MEEDIGNEGSGITIGYVFRTIFSQKWLALILAALITIVGVLGLYFWGKRSEVYSASFVLQLPYTGDVATTSYTYPDGESFYYTDLKSSSTLEKVAAGEGFEKINIKKMVKKDDIKILRSVDRVDVNSNDGVYDLNYTIKVKSSYFKNEDEARAFIEALVSIPRNHIISMNINYDMSLTTSKLAITYAEQLARLKNQTTYIQSEYENLIKGYGQEFVTESGKTLAQYKDEIDQYISQDLFTSLKGLADKYGYIKSEEAKLKYEGDKESKLLALERANKKLEALKEMQVGSTIIDGQIVAIAEEIGNLQYELGIIQTYLDTYENAIETPQEFKDAVDGVEEAVTAFTNDIKPVASYVYGKVTKINYMSTNVVEIEGGRGLMISTVLSLVAGIVVAAIVAYIVGWSKQKKAATQSAAAPNCSEAQLQAAVTDETEDKK